MRITETQRAVAHNHAAHQLHCLEACPRASAEDLGRARTVFNRTHTSSETEEVDAAVAQLDQLVCEAYAGNPPTERH